MEQEVKDLKERVKRLEILTAMLADTISRYGIAFPGIANNEEPIMERLEDIESRLDSIAPEE